MRKPRALAFPLTLALLAVAGLAINLYATRWGAALSDDSYYYIKPARDLLAGLTPQFREHYPPALPLLLAGLGKVSGQDPLAVIRWLNAVCFGANIFMCGWLVRRASGSLGAGAAAALVALLAQPLLEVHAWAMSEALYLTFILSGMLAAGAYLETRRLGWFALSVGLAAASALTRYAGLAMIAALALVYLLYPGRPWKRRLLDGIGFGAGALALFALYPLSGAPIGIELNSVGGLHFRWIEPEALRELLYNSLLWLVPGRLVRGHEFLAFGLLVGLIAGALAVVALTRRAALRAWLGRLIANPLPLLCLAFALISFYLLYQANQADRYRSPFDFRLLAPIHLALLLFTFSLLGLAWKGLLRAVRGGLLVLLVVLVGLYAQRALDTVRLYHEQGMGFAARFWHDSDLIDFVRSVDPAAPLITTAPVGIYFATGRDTPIFLDYTPQKLAETLRQQGGYFIVVESMPLELYGVEPQTYLEGLKVAHTLNNAVIYQSP